MERLGYPGLFFIYIYTMVSDSVLWYGNFVTFHHALQQREVLVARVF